MLPASVRNHLAASSGLEDLELRAVRNRGLEIRRARGEISCAECRRYVVNSLCTSKATV